jgi:hypothetical protein
MMRSRTKRFIARDDAGRLHPLDIYTDYAPAGTPENPHAMTEGHSELFTLDRRRVQRKEKGVYEIIETGVNPPIGLTRRALKSL